MINNYNNPKCIQMISVSGIFTQVNQYFYHLFMLSFKYTVTCSSHFTCSLKLTVLTKLIFSNCVIMVCSCINLVQICLKIVRTFFFKLKSLALDERGKYICLSVGTASETPKLIHYRVVLFHTPDIGLNDL